MVVLQLMLLARDSDVGVLTASSDGDEDMDVRDDVRASAFCSSFRGVKKLSASIAAK